MTPTESFKLEPRHRAIFDSVTHGLKSKNEVGWDDAEESTRLAMETLQFPESREFLAACLDDIVRILLMQKHGMLTPERRHNVESTLKYARVAITSLLEKGDPTHLKTLARIFNKGATYFKNTGDRYPTNYAIQGNPLARIDILKNFHRAGGFKFMLKAFNVFKEKGVEAWVGKDGLGAANLRLLMQGLVDCLRFKESRRLEVDDTARAGSGRPGQGGALRQECDRSSSSGVSRPGPAPRHAPGRRCLRGHRRPPRLRVRAVPARTFTGTRL